MPQYRAVKDHAQPFEIAIDTGFGTRLGAWRIEILDAQDPGAAGGAGIEKAGNGGNQRSETAGARLAKAQTARGNELRIPPSIYFIGCSRMEGAVGGNA